MRIWYHVLDNASGSDVSDIVGVLAGDGIDAFRLDGAQAAGPGFFVFDHVSPSVCDWLTGLTRGGQDRVGESGTGKELVARLVHALDRRTVKKEFVVLDCSTLIPQLSGSEFFGHERGAFTGAITARDGAFALAHEGTLFLDEVGELPPDMQAQLLRVVQEGTFKRIGGNNWKRTEFRLICATNRDLEAEVAAGRFRTDLYYRIAGIRCRLPSPRERSTDIPVLIDPGGQRILPSAPARQPHVMQKRTPQTTTTVPVPDHTELKAGTLSSIIRQSGLPRSIFES
jgi:hypothetical protein